MNSEIGHRNKYYSKHLNDDHFNAWIFTLTPELVEKKRVMLQMKYTHYRFRHLRKANNVGITDQLANEASQQKLICREHPGTAIS